MTQPVPEPDYQDEDLVAYLDGELDGDRARSLEDSLASDPGLRDRLNGLERAWGALDTLPVGEPTEVFTRSTMELVLGEVRKKPAPSSRWFSRRVAAAGLMVLAPFALGGISYGLIRQWQNRPEQDLIRDLQVIRNVDAYNSVGEIRFLEMLRDASVFQGEAVHEHP